MTYFEQPLKHYTDMLASGAPAPGGGSAAALVGALGAALNSMVANFTVGR
ncbi:MAG: cyclodeaminase/cyclohydrolase family protein, partial [Armatimonadota bacterium]